MTVGGVDTYYDYEQQQWMSRRLGGGPIRRGPVCPAPRTADHGSDRMGRMREHDEVRAHEETPSRDSSTLRV